MLKPNLHTYSCISLFCIFIATLALGFSLTSSGVKISTDLNSLSPQLTLPREVSQAINEMTQSASSSFKIMLSSDSEPTIENALDELMAAVDESSTFEFRDQSQLIEKYTSTLEQYSFFILSPQQNERIKEADKNTLIENAKNSLFGQQAWFRLTNLEPDPFGFVNEFASSAANLFTMSAGEISKRSKPKVNEFYTIQSIHLSSNSHSISPLKPSVLELLNLIEKLSSAHPEIEINVSGMALYSIDSSETSQQNITLISTISTVAVILLITTIFRSILAIMLPLIATGLGALVAFILCHSVYGSLHILTIVFGASLIGVAVDYSIHFLYDYQPDDPQKNKSLQRALLISMLTSAIGYSALSFAGLLSLQQIALFSVSGLCIACLTVIAFGPTFCKTTPKRDQTLQNVITYCLSKFASFPASTLFSIPILTLIFGLTLRQGSLPHDDHPSALYHLNPELIRQESAIQMSNKESFEPATFLLIEGDKPQDIFDTLQILEGTLGGGYESIQTIANFLPSPEQQKDNYAVNKRLYGDPNLLNELNENLGLELDAIAISESYKNSNGILTANTLMYSLGPEAPPIWLEGPERVYSLALIKKGSDLAALRNAAKNLNGLTFFSAVESAETSLSQLRLNALMFLILALALITALMLWRFPPKLALLMVSVPLLSVVSTLSIFCIANIEMTLFHTMALFLILGLGMDYTVFSAELSERRILTQSAISLSAITSMLSFGLLSLSELPAVQAFGLTVLIGNTCNYFGSLVLAAKMPRIHTTEKFKGVL